MTLWRFRSAPVQPVLADGALTLAPFTLGDVQRFTELAAQLVADPEVLRAMVTFPNPFTRRHAHQRIRQSHIWLRQNRGWSLGVRWNGQLIGQAQMVCLGHRQRVGEVAYWIAPQFQGNGLGRLAMALLIEGVRQHWPLERLEATVMPGNKASVRLLESLGFVFIEQAEVPFQVEDAPWWASIWTGARAQQGSASLLIFGLDLTIQSHDKKIC